MRGKNDVAFVIIKDLCKSINEKIYAFNDSGSLWFSSSGGAHLIPHTLAKLDSEYNGIKG